MVSIALCTCDRAEFLCQALESIRRQTARHAITRVVVSENGNSEASHEVCRQFSDLPILYLRQQPPVPPLQHLKVIWERLGTRRVAILHDDDWWAPDHLETALRVLESHPECAAVYSNFFETSRPRYPFWVSEVQWLAWLGAAGDFASSVVRFDRAGVMLACLLNAGFHYSTVVGRAEAMQNACLRNVARGNAFDNDRTFPVFLSAHGPVGYVTKPTAFIREHPFRDAWRPEYLDKHFEIAQETTRWLRKTYPEIVAEAAARFNELVLQVDPHQAESLWAALRNRVREPQRSTLIHECGVKLGSVSDRVQRVLLPPWCNHLIGELCPPLLWRAAMRMRGGWEGWVRRWQAAELAQKEVDAASKSVLLEEAWDDDAQVATRAPRPSGKQPVMTDSHPVFTSQAYADPRSAP